MCVKNLLCFSASTNLKKVSLLLLKPFTFKSKKKGVSCLIKILEWVNPSQRKN